MDLLWNLLLLHFHCFVGHHITRFGNPRTDRHWTNSFGSRSPRLVCRCGRRFNPFCSIYSPWWLGCCACPGGRLLLRLRVRLLLLRWWRWLYDEEEEWWISSQRIGQSLLPCTASATATACLCLTRTRAANVGIPKCVPS